MRLSSAQHTLAHPPHLERGGTATVAWHARARADVQLRVRATRVAPGRAEVREGAAPRAWRQRPGRREGLGGGGGGRAGDACGRPHDPLDSAAGSRRGNLSSAAIESRSDPVRGPYHLQKEGNGAGGVGPPRARTPPVRWGRLQARCARTRVAPRPPALPAHLRGRGSEECDGKERRLHRNSCAVRASAGLFVCVTARSGG